MRLSATKIVEGGGQNKRSRQIRGIEKAEGKAKVGRRTRGRFGGCDVGLGE